MLKRVLWALVLSCGLTTGLWGEPENAPPSAKAEARFAEAQRQWAAGRLDRAEEGFAEAAQLAPGWPTPLACQGVVRQLQGRDEDARRSYRDVQRLSLQADAQARELDEERRELLAGLEGLLCWLINRERQRAGAALLVPDTQLALVARRHSAEMRDLEYFSHESPTPALGTPSDRFRQVFGCRPRCLAENLSRRWGAASRLTEEKITDSHQGLMESTGHKANILCPTFQGMGIGLAADPAGAYWLTEVFVQWR